LAPLSRLAFFVGAVDCRGNEGGFRGAFAYGAGFHEPIVFLAASTLRTFPKRFFGFLFAAFILPATLSLALTKSHRQIFKKGD